MKAEAYQDPSALLKRALFRSLVIGAVAVVIYLFCVEPCQTSLDKAREENVALRDQENEMERDLRGAGQVKSRLAAVTAGRQVYLDGLLEPLLESYAMRAKSLLDPLAADVGLTISNYAEGPVRRLPLPQHQAPQLYARQPIRLTCTGSYATIVSFLLRVEEKMPLVSLQSFSLKTQKDVDNQSAMIVLEWPIKGENTAAAKGGAKK